MLLLALLLLCANSVFAQIAQVKGHVFSQEDGGPVIGAYVVAEGTTIAAITGLDGNFLLEGIPADCRKITVSNVGFETLTLDIAEDMKIYLPVKAELMDEVIVVAFGKQKREAFTGSASVVNSATIESKQSTNPIDILKGMVPGMQMTDNNAVYSGAEPTIRIRGYSSLNANNEPLVIVDGLPYSGYLSDINPADIENMTVLKDAASNALYGARGANGVIMITTKNAQRGNTKVNFDAKWGVNTNGRVEYDIIDNPGEYYEAFYMAHRNNFMYRQENPLSASEAHIKANAMIPRTGENGGLGYVVYSVPEGEFLIGNNGRLNPHATLGNRVAYNNEVYTLYPDNWLKEGTRNGLRQEYNLSLTGGDEKFSMMGSLGYLENHGISRANDFKRFSSKLKMNWQAYPFLRVGANAGFTNTVSDALGAVFATPYTIAPIYPLYVRDGDGNIMYDSHGPRYDNGNYDMGVERYTELNGNSIQDDRYDISNNDSNAYNIQGFATLDFLKYFHLTVNGSIYVTENRIKEAYNPYYGFSTISGGSTTVSHYRTADMNVQQLLNFNRTVNGHSIDALLGHEYSRTVGTGLWATSKNIANYESNTEVSGAIVRDDHGSYRSLYNVEGFFGRVQYDYDSRYFGSVSYRLDGSSNFHPDHRWGSFWSVGGAWILSKEDWFPKSDAVNMLKFKASYGEQGNDGIGSFRYTDMYYITNSNNNVAYSFASKGSEDITWESVGNFNTGFEFEFFKSRLNGSIEYYWRKTSDMLMYFSSPWEIGYDGYYDNVGDMVNTGVEASLSADIIRTRNVNWNFGMNISWQKNRITYIPEAKAGRVIDGHKGYVDGSLFYGEGLPIYTYYTKRFAGVDENGRALYYRDGDDGMETTTDYSLADYYLCGDAMPTVFGGFNTSLSFYGVDISAQFDYSLGGKKWDSGYQGLMFAPTTLSNGAGIHRDVFKAWTPENTNTDIPMYYYGDVYSAATSDKYLQSADYLAFRNLTIGYTFPQSISRKLKMEKLRIFALCENVAYWTTRKGFDPRTGLTSGSYGGYAPMRTITGGIQIQF